MFILAGVGNNIDEIPIGLIKNIKDADFVFFEYYTNFVDREVLDYLKNYNNKIELVDRDFVENKLEEIILSNRNKKILLIVSGSPLYATTHIYFLKLCKENNIEYKVINAPSIFDELGKIGISLYKFGRTVSVPFHYSESFYDHIVKNYKNGYHTLLLLDLDPKTGKFLSHSEALDILLDIDKKRENLFSEDTEVIVCSNINRKNERIYFGKIKLLKKIDLDPPLCIIIPSNLNKIEKEFILCMTYYIKE